MPMKNDLIDIQYKNKLDLQNNIQKYIDGTKTGIKLFNFLPENWKLINTFNILTVQLKKNEYK